MRLARNVLWINRNKQDRFKRAAMRELVPVAQTGQESEM
jgi:hypothetical protein